ncbi:hypothetical protein CVE36_13690 [Pseudomonas syringae pv. actinidiae]|nr:hypothetical protein [Pseudomonas syringae pv. actinidiae]
MLICSNERRSAASFFVKTTETMQPDIAPNPHSTRPGLSRRFAVAPMIYWANLSGSTYTSRGSEQRSSLVRYSFYTQKLSCCR